MLFSNYIHFENLGTHAVGRLERSCQKMWNHIRTINLCYMCTLCIWRTAF